MTFRRAVLPLLALLLAYTALPAHAQPFALTRSTISAGGTAPTPSSGGSFVLGSTVGQTAPGASQSASFRLGSGYWPSVTGAAVASPPPTAGGVLYVDADATGANDGSSWANAFTDLQDALGVATGSNQIWIADGTYVPTSGTDRTVSFAVAGGQDGLKIYGGFVGGEANLSDRDVAGNPPAVLSGDIGTTGDKFDNSYHVLLLDGTTGGGITTSTVLDGLTVTGGRAFGPSAGIFNLVSDREGGGLYCDGRSGGVCSPSLIGVTFDGNEAASAGGGIYANGIQGTSSPTITDAVFRSNTSDRDGGAIFSAALIVDTDVPATSSPQITRTLFTGNRAAVQGGAIFGVAGANGPSNNVAKSSPQITGAIFANNEALEGGGAMYLAGTGSNGVINAQVVNSVFVSNGDNHIGYGDGSGTPPRFVNCTFTGATQSTVFSEPLDSGGSPLEIVNSILFDDSGDVVGGFSEDPTDPSTSLDPAVDVTFSVVQEASFVSGGANTINADPLFADASDPDGTDDVFGTADDGLRLQAGSPALDAGDDAALPSGITTDITGAARIQDSAVDLGAYERAASGSGGGASPAPLRAVGPATVLPGETFTVDIVAGDATTTIADLFGVAFDLVYDLSILEDAEAGDAEPGPFLAPSSGPDGSPIFDVTATADNSAPATGGRLAIGLSRKRGTTYPSVTGPVTVATITLRARADALPNQTATLSLPNASILAVDEAGQQLAVEGVGADVTVEGLAVWPGDADNSGSADAAAVAVTVIDLFPVGLCFGVTTKPGVSGAPRPGGFDISWGPKGAPSFGFPPSGGSEPCNSGIAPAFTDPAFADGTGDGVIDARDVLPIGVNFGLARTDASGSPAALAAKAAAPAGGAGPTSAVASLRLSAPQKGQLYRLTVRLDAPMDDLFGVAARLHLPPGHYALESVQPGALLASGDDLSVSDYDAASGRLSAAFTRKRGSASVRGAGPVMEVVLRATRTAPEPVEVHLAELTASHVGRPASSAPAPALTSPAAAGARPTAVQVNAPYPNPAAGRATLTYELPEATAVRIALFDVLGREVAVLVDGEQPAGTHRHDLATAQLPSGLYVYRVQVGAHIRTHKLTVVR